MQYYTSVDDVNLAEEMEYLDSQVSGPTYEVVSGGITSGRKLELANEDWAMGDKKVLVLLVCWEGSCDGTKDDVFGTIGTDALLQEVYQKVDDFFTSNSNGKLQMERLLHQLSDIKPKLRK